MTATVSPPVPAPVRSKQRRGKRSPSWPERSKSGARDILGRYTDRAGRAREIVARPGAGGSTLVVDRDAVTLGERRLVAHLAADEPAQNARLVCEQYLADGAGRWCRKVLSADLSVVPFAEDEQPGPEPEHGAGSAEAMDAQTMLDKHGRTYRLEIVATRMSIPEVRWLARPEEGQHGPARVVSVRDVIAALENYEPVRAMTQLTLNRYRRDPKVSVSILRGELDRVYASRIVLNRGLREAVLSTAKAKGLSMSEIAMRCGRVKYDSRGNVSGETSWLSRRLGLAPEGGESSPTPWVHSDVLALIARRGLGISPREVELG
jgi:hypothetical protein